MARRTAPLAAALALLTLGACAPSFNANVSRFQQLPVPSGQSFTVVADDARLAGGLEFAQYAALVAGRMGAVGFRPADDPASADLVVRMRYDVDQGREKVRSTGFADPYYARGYWGGYYGRPYHWGYHDPFLFGSAWSGMGPEVESYTVYTSTLDLRIDRASGERVFEGKASAQSLSNRLTYLVPNLVDAMFTNFPGKSGETVKITVPPEKRK